MQGAGKTVGDLADAYVFNTLCGKKYQEQVDEQKLYIEDMLKKKKDTKENDGI